jgi:formylglycine-generating enzyme required for sulfatase activity
VSVNAFWIDETPVTNAQFARFVKATGHVTFAELPPNPADYPGMDPTLTAPGSIVFVPPQGPVDLQGDPIWWQFMLGADWRHPTGPESSTDGLKRHPVVHVALSDAQAYAAWAGKSLPTEAEWEYVARGGLAGKAYAWGDEFMPGGRRMAKTWEGLFPWHNTAPSGMERTAPVRGYPANDYGVHDMIGNVWEWTADPYTTSGNLLAPSCCGGSLAPPTIDRYVAKGGSHLCAPEYCLRYRPAARWAQPLDTTVSHMGFRCVLRT